MREHKTGTWMDSRLSPTEYITKAAAQDAWGNIRLTYEEFEQLDDAIDSIPPADVEPVRRGTWEITSTQDGNRLVTCPICYYSEIRDEWLPNFCPGCGAKMSGEDEQP